MFNIRGGICKTLSNYKAVIRSNSSFRNMSSANDLMPEAPRCPNHPNTTKKAEDQAEAGPIEQSIERKIKKALNPTFFEMRNDSWMHEHHKPMQNAGNRTESHFNMIVISEIFKDYRGLPSRHRLIYKLLEDELQNKGVHALQIKAKTPEEWQRELANKAQN